MAPLTNKGHVNCEGIYATGRTEKASKTCSICHHKGHQAKCCPEIKCYYCGRSGHTQKLCWFKLANKTANYQRAIKSINYGNSSNLFKQSGWLEKGGENSDLQVTNMEISYLNSSKKDDSPMCKCSLDVSKFCISLGSEMPFKISTMGEPQTEKDKKSAVEVTEDLKEKRIINLEENNNIDITQFDLDFNKLELSKNKVKTTSHVDREVMVSKIPKHFDIIEMDVEHPYNLCCLLFGQEENQRSELESVIINEESLQFIINNCSGTFYIYVPETEEEIKISPLKKKSTFNVFCYYGCILTVLIPYEESLIGNRNHRRNCGNKIKEKIASLYQITDDYNNESGLKTPKGEEEQDDY